jgi:hypothetical protein
VDTHHRGWNLQKCGSESSQVAVSECQERPFFPAEGLHGDQGKSWCVYRFEAAIRRQFGTAAWEVLELTRANANLVQPLIPGIAQIQAEVVYGVREELAADIEDVISRRMGLQYYSWRDAIKAAPVVGYLMAQELQWTSAQELEAVKLRGGIIFRTRRFASEAGPVGRGSLGRNNVKCLPSGPSMGNYTARFMIFRAMGESV